MSKKLSKEQQDKARSIVEELELPELPDVQNYGTYDAEALSFRDKTGKTIQGAGVDPKRFGLRFVAIPRDTAPDAADRQRAQLRDQGYARIEGDKVVCVGLSGAEIWYTTHERYLAIEAARRSNSSTPHAGQHTREDGARRDHINVAREQVVLPSDPDKE